MTKRIKYTVHGEVQGVNFRSFTQSKASSYGLTGWVKNTSGGQVEGEAQGDDEAIQKLLKVLESGPPSASVTKVEKSEVDPKDGESSYVTK
ncbi:MAG: hypothetical protein L6R40_001399 [Gallowayella cf. fulva]|nr:MAG: hypothetical protein L6R40_001399 [Xanthomendoza cf. fulva]